MKHANKFQEASFITSIFIFVAKMGCVAFNCYSHYIIMKYIYGEKEISSMSGPLFLIGAFTYICASMFLGLFDSTISAFLTCLSVDSEVHDENPKFGPPEFHDLIANFFDIEVQSASDDAEDNDETAPTPQESEDLLTQNLSLQNDDRRSDNLNKPRKSIHRASFYTRQEKHD